MSLSAIEQKVMDFIKTSFPVESAEISLSTNLLATGVLDSMGVIGIIDFVEKNYDIVIPDEDITIEQFCSVEKISEYISTHATVQ